jgi:hypothetical protein
MIKKIKCHIVETSNYKPVSEWTIKEVKAYVEKHNFDNCKKCPFMSECTMDFQPCTW